ncbi:MAG: hypothetical protein R6U96_05435 [Promethearchaeia archaeon]
MNLIIGARIYLEIVIEVEELSKVFYNKESERDIWAVDNISFNIHNGEIFGLLKISP